MSRYDIVKVAGYWRLLRDRTIISTHNTYKSAWRALMSQSEEGRNMIHEKPASRLFSNVSGEDYSRVIENLEGMRQRFPAYRDDELLVFMIIVQQHPKRRWTAEG